MAVRKGCYYDDIFLSAVGATPKDYRCRFLAFPLQIFVRNIYFDCCLYTKIKVLHRT